MSLGHSVLKQYSGVGTKYEVVQQNEFVDSLRKSLLKFPITIDKEEIESSVQGIEKSEMVHTIYFTDKASGDKFIVKGYTGFDKRRGSRYGDAMRIIGFFQIDDGRYLPLGSADKYHLRIYHTKNWRKSLDEKFGKLYTMLIWRGMNVHTEYDNIMLQINDSGLPVKTVPTSGKDYIKATIGPGFIEKPKFVETVGFLKSLRFRWQPNTKEWLWSPMVKQI